MCCKSFIGYIYDGSVLFGRVEAGRDGVDAVGVTINVNNSWSSRIDRAVGHVFAADSELAVISAPESQRD